MPGAPGPDREVAPQDVGPQLVAGHEGRGERPLGREVPHVADSFLVVELLVLGEAHGHVGAPAHAEADLGLLQGVAFRERLVEGEVEQGQRVGDDPDEPSLLHGEARPTS